MTTQKSWGLPYMGSKNKLCKKILPLFQKAEHLIDLFCGGCAVTHYAAANALYPHIHFNDLNAMMVNAFVSALRGEFNDEKRWISHEEFMRLRDTDSYAAICFSFGNKLRSYAYSPRNEAFKSALHKAIFFLDFDEMRERYGIDLSAISRDEDVRERYIHACSLVREFKNNSPQNHELRRVCLRLETSQHIQALFRMQNVSSEFTVFSDFELLRIGGASKVELRVKTKGEKVVRLTSGTEDYRNVEIPSGSVIYCDIPYNGTEGYKNTRFDHKAFYEWALRQTEPVVVSSFEMPGDFAEVAIFHKVCSLGYDNRKVTEERLFVPRTQPEVIEEMKQKFNALKQ